MEKGICEFFKSFMCISILTPQWVKGSWEWAWECYWLGELQKGERVNPYYNTIPNHCCNICIAWVCNVLFWGVNHSLSMWKLTPFSTYFYFPGSEQWVSLEMRWARLCTFCGRFVIQLNRWRLYFFLCKYVCVWTLYACSTPWRSVMSRWLW